jgi:hypothetical protein
LSGSYNVFSGSASTRITTVSASQQDISASLLQVSASYIALSGSYNTFSGSASTRVTKIENNYATTGSNSFRADQSITGSLVVSSTITAQTLVVQTVTSSIVYSSGSNIFGSALGDRQTFTGSIYQTGSIAAFAGSMGIGTTTPNAKLDINGNVISTGSITATSGFVATGYPAAAGNGLFIAYNSAGTSTGSIYSYNYNTSTYNPTIIDGSSIYFYNSGASKVSIVGGNVGIGTTAPGAPLEISYNNTSYTTTPILSLNNTNVNGQTHINFLITGSLFGKIRSDYEGGMIYVTNNRGADRSHYFLVNGDVGTGTVAMAISASGRIGMGTSSPAARLDIQGGSDGDGMISMGSNSVSGILNSPANMYINADSDNSSASGVIALGFNRTGYSGGTEAVRILESGNILIGKTTSTGGILQVSNGTNMFNVDYDANGPYITAVNNANTVYKRMTYDASEHVFDISAAQRMHLTSGGYLRLAQAGIQFNNDTADANSLDDYEEGTWTPVVACSSGAAAYSSQLGWYTKIGRVVTIVYFLAFTKSSLSGGTVRLTNFPFTSIGGTFYPQGVVMIDNLSTVTNNITLQSANASTGADFIGGNGGTTDHTGLPIAVLGTGTMNLRGTLTYFAA